MQPSQLCCARSLHRVSRVRLSATLWTVARQAPLSRLLHPPVSPGKDTGVGCHALLQGIFPTQSDSGPINLAGPQHPTRDLGTLAAEAIIHPEKGEDAEERKTL